MNIGGKGGYRIIAIILAVMRNGGVELMYSFVCEVVISSLYNGSSAEFCPLVISEADETFLCGLVDICLKIASDVFWAYIACGRVRESGITMEYGKETHTLFEIV